MIEGVHIIGSRFVFKLTAGVLKSLIYDKYIMIIDENDVSAFIMKKTFI